MRTFKPHLHGATAAGVLCLVALGVDASESFFRARTASRTCRAARSDGDHETDLHAHIPSLAQDHTRIFACDVLHQADFLFGLTLSLPAGMAVLSPQPASFEPVLPPVQAAPSAAVEAIPAGRGPPIR